MIKDILPAALEQKIVQTIQQRCRLFIEAEKNNRKLYYEPYAVSRKKHNLTSVVLSGFAPTFFNMENVETKDLSYGAANLCQPELHTDSAIVQIYSDGAKPMKNAIVQERCRKLNCKNGEIPHFLIIQFVASKNGALSAIRALYPDENCKIIEEKTLYTAPKVSIASVS